MSRTSERRQRRLEALRKEHKRSGLAALLQKPVTWLVAGVGLLVVVVLIAVAGNTPATGAPSTPAARTPSPGALGAEVRVADQGGTHIKPGDPHAPYNSVPPTSGPHYETAAPWTSPSISPLPEELWIHNLEHSGIVALYNCPGGCPDLVKKLEDFRRTGPRSKFGFVKMLVLPYEKTDTQLTLVAWNYYLKLADYDENALREFVLAHQDKGPEPNTP